MTHDVAYLDEFVLVGLQLSRGMEHQKTAEIPAEKAGEAMPDAPGELAGEQ